MIIIKELLLLKLYSTLSLMKLEIILIKFKIIMMKFKSLADVEMKNLKNKPNSILGTGGFSKVRLIYHWNYPDKFFAMKKLHKKNDVEIKYIWKELKLHKFLNHPNIIKYFDDFETPTHHYFILEYAPYGDLFDFMRKEKPNFHKLLEIFY